MNFDLLFPDEREKGATRLKQCHLVLLRMFKIFHYLCRKHDVQYFLCSGTLKGAIRNKGFKPWDDDFDVAMTRDNYEKFVELVVPDLPNDIFFQTPETDPFFPTCHRVEAKLRDKYSSYSLMEDQGDLKYHNGLMMDVHVFDKAFLPSNFFIFLMNRGLKFLFRNKRDGNRKRANALKFIAKYLPVPLVYSNSFINGHTMIKMGANYFKEKEISSTVSVKYEDTEAYIPQGWHSYLERKYGSYMELPPSEKQKGHHSAEIPDPFTPCNHTEILYWKDRKIKSAQLQKV
jgi:lipopolysaccharide cholinephosphotransferase